MGMVVVMCNITLYIFLIFITKTFKKLDVIFSHVSYIFLNILDIKENINKALFDVTRFTDLAVPSFVVNQICIKMLRRYLIQH